MYGFFVSTDNLFSWFDDVNKKTNYAKKAFQKHG